jgi:hypothetical protein
VVPVVGTFHQENKSNPVQIARESGKKRDFLIDRYVDPDRRRCSSAASVVDVEWGDETKKARHLLAEDTGLSNSVGRIRQVSTGLRSHKSFAAHSD